MTMTPLNDETALRDLYQSLLASWARGDAQGYAAHFTQDADYIIATGAIEKGTQEIAAGHQAIFDTWAKNTHLTGTIQSIRFLTPEMALIVATGSIVSAEGVEDEEKTIYSLIAQKQAGRWQFVAYQNTPIHSY
jgi:uncharacterized protein (TIGR02246 family)